MSTITDKYDREIVLCRFGLRVLGKLGGKRLLRNFVNRGHERGFLNSWSYHEMHAMIDRVFPEQRITRRICRLNLFRVFLSSFEWFRKMYGGRWELWIVDFPVCSEVWCDIPDGAPEDYREGLWRGNAQQREDWA